MKRIIGLLFAFLPLLATAVEQSVAVGSVRFAVGQVWHVTPEQQRTPVVVGDDIKEGQCFLTDVSSRTMLAMSDNALLSVHPETEFCVQRYRIDESQSTNNQIELLLKKGSVRSITGRAGQAHKDGYRLITPLVAIGIRGTDFIAQTDEYISRVALVSGAISVAPLHQCAASPNGCAGSMLLDEGQKNMMLEYQRGNTHIYSVPLSSQLLHQASAGPAHSSTEKNVMPQVAASTDKDTVLLNKKVLPLPNTETSTVQPQAPLVPAFHWLANHHSASATVDKNIQLVLMSQGGVWLDQSASLTVPMQGQVALTPVQTQLFVNNLPASVSNQNALLTLNFDQRRFSTQMQLSSSDLPQTVQFGASGYIREDGRFYSNQGGNVSGVLANKGQDAAYIFDLYHLNLPATGVAIWQKSP